jgi:zinc transport system substrate-binding protein
MIMVDRISAAVIALDPANERRAQERTDRLKMRLDELDREFQNGLTACRQKNFVTAHTAFGYLASAYGLTQIGISGLSPEAEPTPQELAEVARFAQANNVKYIFFETLTSPRLAETIAREVGAATLVLNPLEGLADEEEKAGKNYFTEMRQNLYNLKIALQCQ